LLPGSVNVSSNTFSLGSEECLLSGFVSIGWNIHKSRQQTFFWS
jgi:hypothetical protein